MKARAVGSVAAARSRARVASAVVSLVASLAVAGDAGAGPVLREAGRFRSFGRDQIATTFARLAIDTVARRIYEIHPAANDAGQIPVIEEIDADTLRFRRRLTIPGANVASNPGARVDEARHRLLLPVSVLAGIDQQIVMKVVDGRTLKVSASYTLVDGFGGRQVYGLSYFGPEDRLYVLSMAAGVTLGGSGTDTVVLSQWDATAGTLDWSYPVPGCQIPVGAPSTQLGGLSAGLGRSAVVPAVYFACGTNQPLGETSRFPGNPAAVRVRIDPALRSPTGAASNDKFAIESYPIAGDFNVSVFEPGSDRLLMFSRASGSRGAWIFDGRRSVFVGNASLDYTPSMAGVDTATGRVYLDDASPNVYSLALQDVRPTDPVAQPLLYKQFQSYGQGLLAVDPPTRRFFYMARTDDQSAETWWIAVRDDLSVYRPAAPDDPDVNSVDLPEREGVTDANYSGAGQAFGVRTRLVGGPGAVQDNFIGAELDTLLNNALYGNNDFNRTLRDQNLRPKLGGVFLPADGSRDFFFGFVRSAFLARQETSASSTAADADGNTRADLYNASHAQLTRPNTSPSPTDPNSLLDHPLDIHEVTGSELAWPFGVADCRDFSGSKPHRAAEESPQGRAEAACDLRARRVGATAVFDPAATFGNLVHIGRAWSDVRLERASAAGIVARAASEAKDVEIRGEGLPGAIRIGSVSASGWARARGRPGTARGSFTRTIDDVVVSRADGSVVYACGSTLGPLLPAEEGERACRPDAIAAAVTTVFGPRIQVFFPSPDDGALAGTPGGYEALVRRNGDRAQEESALDENTLDAVPAMVIVLNGDGHSRSRLLLHLAGIEAEAHYGIFFLPRYAQPGGGPILRPPAPPGAPAPTTTIRRTPGKPTTTVQEIVRRIPTGFRLALSGGRQATRLAAIWALLLAPLYVALRRRSLVTVRAR